MTVCSSSNFLLSKYIILLAHGTCLKSFCFIYPIVSKPFTCKISSRPWDPLTYILKYFSFSISQSYMELLQSDKMQSSVNSSDFCPILNTSDCWSNGMPSLVWIFSFTCYIVFEVSSSKLMILPVGNATYISISLFSG